MSLTYLHVAPCYGLSALCKDFVTKNDRFLEIKTLFSRTKVLETQGCNQCGELFIVLEDSVSTALIFVANNLV